jgi:hypothetical protein
MQRKSCLFPRTPQFSAPVRMMGVMLVIVVCIFVSEPRGKSQYETKELEECFYESKVYTIAVSVCPKPSTIEKLQILCTQLI